MWNRIKDDLVAETESIAMGDVTDFSNFMGAVIDDRAFAKHKAAIARVRRNKHLTLLAGGQTDDSVGYFVRPTIVQSTDPTDQMFNTEYFGPILAVHVYDDARYERVVQQMESFAPYALTGAVIAQDRDGHRLDRQDALRFAAGNFYINDKPTGAVVGQQPFGGARASGTNDKAGAAVNLLRWTSPRSIKETFVPPDGLDVPLLSSACGEHRRLSAVSRRRPGAARRLLRPVGGRLRAPALALDSPWLAARARARLTAHGDRFHHGRSGGRAVSGG